MAQREPVEHYNYLDDQGQKRCKHGMLPGTCAHCEGILYGDPKRGKGLSSKERHRLTVIEYLSNPSNPFIARSRFHTLCGISNPGFRRHFSLMELLNLESEAFELRKKLMLRSIVKVYDALLESATGYEHDAIHISSYLGTVTQTDIIKRYPPNTAAAQELLNRIEGTIVARSEVTGADGKPLYPEDKKIRVDLTVLATDELKQLRDLLAKAATVEEKGAKTE